jgi:GMP synthase-like glutamine amidotransferase
VKTALVLGHGDSIPLNLDAILGEFGFSYTNVNRTALMKYASTEDFDLQIHLGSDWSLASGTVSTDIQQELQLIENSFSRGVPVLGICFGAQLLSVALGGSVRRSANPEIGWFNLDSRAIGCSAESFWMQWHYDSIVAPLNSEVLISGVEGAQAFRSDLSLGLQFHPEADQSVLTDWFSEGGESELKELGLSAKTLMAETRLRSAKSILEFKKLFVWYAESVGLL